MKLGKKVLILGGTGAMGVPLQRILSGLDSISAIPVEDIADAHIQAALPGQDLCDGHYFFAIWYISS